MPPDFRGLVREMPGAGRCDLTPLLGDPDAFAALLRALAEPFLEAGITRVAALDAIGFALGGGVAQRLRAGLVLVRKAGKVAWTADREPFIDYSGEGKAFEVAEDALTPADRVLVVDDWSETGSQLRAAITLVERSGARVVGAALVNVDPRVRRDPRLGRYRLHAAMEY